MTDTSTQTPDGFEAPEALPAYEDAVLPGLGIHGWEEIESAVLSAVMLGEPFCLVSEPGSGKTYLGSVLAKALDMPYGYYDLSRAQFEDVIGFPNAKAFQEGRSEFIHNELTIWDKEIVMVDEVSRPTRETSNSWLEVLGSRRLMGKALPVKVIIGAMNPIEHQNTRALDEAFADRFISFIRLPEFTSMDEGVRREILSGATGLDAPTAGHWAGLQDAQPGEDAEAGPEYVIATAEFAEAAGRLRGLLAASGRHYQAIIADGEYAGQVTKYADTFATALAGQAQVSLEPRRLKMLRRSILAMFAVESARQGLEPGVYLEKEEMTECARRAAGMSMPHPYTGQGGLTAEQLLAAHAVAAAALVGDVALLALYQSSTQAEKLRRLLEGKFRPTVQNKVVEEFLDDGSMEADACALVAVQLLLTDEVVKHLPAHLMGKLAQRYNDVRLSSHARLPLEVGPDLADRIAEFDAVDSLAAHAAREDVSPLEAWSVQWAFDKCDGSASSVFEGYEAMREQMLIAMRELHGLCVAWGVDGAEGWTEPEHPGIALPEPAADGEAEPSAA